MASAGNLRVRLGLELKEFNKGMRGVQRQLKGFRTLALGAFAAIGVQKLVSFGRSAAAQADRVAKLNQSLGESVEFLQFMDFAAQRSGSNIQAFGTIIQRLQKRVGEFNATGGGELSQVIDELSMEFREAAASGASFEQLLPILIRDFQAMDTNAQKLRVAFKLFDSEGARPFLQFISEGEGGVKELRDRFEELGGAASGESLKTIEGFNDAMTDFNTALQQLAVRILPILTPALQGMADVIGPIAKQIGEMVQGIKLLKQLGFFGGGVDFQGLGANAPPANAPGGGPAGGGGRRDRGSLGLGVDAMEIESLAPAMEEIRAELDQTRTGFDEFSDVIENWGLTFGETMGVTFTSLADGMADSVGQAIVFGENLGESMKRVMKNVAAFIISSLIKIAIKKIFLEKLVRAEDKKTAVASIGTSAGSMFGKVADWFAKINPFIAIPMAILFTGLMLAGAFAQFAEGGLVLGPTLGLVGEAGPELIVPLDKMDQMFGARESGPVVVQLDGDVLATAMVERIPGQLRSQGIGS